MPTVLVIDDNEQLLELYREVLTGIGCEVYTSDNGENGIRLAREQDPDCIMLDIMMSDMDGLDTLQQLTQYDSSVPVVIITSFPSTEHAIEALKRGAFDFLTKGCTIEEVTATAKRALDRRRLYLENRALLAKLQDTNETLERQINEATEEIRELFNFNQSLLEGIDAGLLAANEQGVVLFANLAARRILQLAAHQIIGENLSHFGFEIALAATVKRRAETPHLGGNHFVGRISSVESQLGRVQRRTTYRTPDGAVRVFGYSISTTQEGENPESGTRSIVLFRDMTDTEELRLQMQRLQKLEALNVVVAGVAHEIKNPIAGIKGVAAVLYEGMEPDDPHRQFIARILDESRRVSKIVEDFFSFSRPSKPKLEAAPIAEIIDRVVHLMADNARQRNIEIVVAPPPDIPQLRIDKDQIQQVTLNLVLNSLEAVGRDGRIEINVDDVDYRVLGQRCVRIQVRDSGPGFPEDVRHRLFDPFYTTKPSGTGLGLHISQSIVFEHGGRMEASNHVDGGALVSVYLPFNPSNTSQSA